MCGRALTRLQHYPHVTGIEALNRTFQLLIDYMPAEISGSAPLSAYCVRLVADRAIQLRGKRQPSDLLTTAVFRALSSCDLSILQPVLATVEDVVFSAPPVQQRQLLAYLKAVVTRTFDMGRKAALDLWYLEMVKELGFNHSFEQVKVSRRAHRSAL